MVMYQFASAEILEGGPQGASRRQRQAMQRAIELLEFGQQKGARSTEAAERLNYLNKMWHVFIEDLANSGDELPELLRAELISIGIWISNEVNRMRLGKSENFNGLIEICTIIRHGLK
jgi:flagellar biosynthesis activator protein FlaF